MTLAGWAEIVLYVAVLTALTPVLGAYMTRVYGGERTLLAPVLAPFERATYRLLGTSPAQGMGWKAYARAVLAFSAVSWAGLYLVLRTQGVHPANPRDLPAPPWDLSFNTATSFVTNTNWQFYAGETTMSHLSQMAGLAVQNFVSAGVGMAVLVALIRGLAARTGGDLGNFWVDLTRSVLYVLLPVSVVFGLLLASQGVVQTLQGPIELPTLAGGSQTVAVGPVASQEVIKQFGTNGGGFFNVNSAHPLENPTWLTNFVELVLILAIPAALTATYGRMVGNRRQGWAVFAAMMGLFLVFVTVAYAAESGPTPARAAAGLEGGNLEGKEQRFGVASTALWVAVTTAASCGAVNGAMESLSGLGSLVPLAQMGTGEVIFGGVGSGLYGMLLFVLLAVFLAGLMVGRTPEYLGKKIEAREVRIVALATLAVPLVVLAFTAFAVATDLGRASVFNSGPQGFSETLYAYASQANNNGSAFAGYTAFLQPEGGNTGSLTVTFSQLLGALAMLAGRFLPMVAVLAVAGSLAGKRVSPPSTGTMRTDTATFVVLLIATVLLVALLTFVPSLLLGPIAQGLTDRLFG